MQVSPVVHPIVDRRRTTMSPDGDLVHNNTVAIAPGNVQPTGNYS